jgi:hypothetical protein
MAEPTQPCDARTPESMRLGAGRADAERLAALIKALTGREPKMYQKSDGTIEAICYEEHLNGFRRYAELADAIEKWLEETGR